jgi:hypothetical protein
MRGEARVPERRRDLCALRRRCSSGPQPLGLLRRQPGAFGQDFAVERLQTRRRSAARRNEIISRSFADLTEVGGALWPAPSSKIRHSQCCWRFHSQDDQQHWFSLIPFLWASRTGCDQLRGPHNMRQNGRRLICTLNNSLITVWSSSCIDRKFRTIQSPVPWDEDRMVLSIANISVINVLC